MSYAQEHAGALADVRAAGAAVAFTIVNQGTHDPLTEQSGPPTTDTVTGVAIRTKGDPKKYEALKLVQTEAPTLLFVPDTYGQLPKVGMKVTWGSNVYTVRDVEPLDPDGRNAILAKVIIGK